MKQIFNFTNYKDRNYTLLLVSVVLCLGLSQTVLIPSLDYVALSIKNNNHTFYNYATIAALAASLPPASSLFAGYLVNNIAYKTLISLICGIITFLCLVAFFYHQNFIMYAIFVLCCGILFNALYCGLDRQIVTLLADKIREFQSDFFITSGVSAIVNYKISNYLFLHLGLYGIMGYSLLLTVIIYNCLNAIYIDPTITQNQAPKANLPNIRVLLKILLKHRKLITFLGIMLTIMFISSGLILLLTTKIHHENLPTTLWSSNMAFMAFGSLLGAITCKARFFKNLNGIATICVAEALYGMCLFAIPMVHSANGLIAIIWLSGFLTPFVLINMNTIFFKYISRDTELIGISPVVNGFIMSAFYILCLIGPMILNQLLQFGIDYKILLILAIILINIKVLRTDFP